MLHAETLEQNRRAKIVLLKRREEYSMSRHKKWMVCFVGILLGCLLGYAIPTIQSMLTSSLYDRSSMDALMDFLLPTGHVKDALSDEIMLVAYEFNS